ATRSLRSGARHSGAKKRLDEMTCLESLAGDSEAWSGNDLDVSVLAGAVERLDTGQAVLHPARQEGAAAIDVREHLLGGRIDVARPDRAHGIVHGVLDA